MNVQRNDIELTQGMEYSFIITVSDEASNAPVDLTGYSVRSNIKYRYSDASPLTSFSCFIAEPETGSIQVNLTAVQSSSLPATQLLYSVDVYNSSNNFPVLEGYINVYPIL